ncbi:MAG: type II and III secretion system protein family protein [bacterium]|nr:type II and III secretion system protein family protein [bacterium]
MSSLTVAVHKSRVINLPGTYAEVLVGNEKIADILPLTDKSVYILGKKIGTTSIAIVDSQKHVLAVLEVDVTPNISGLNRKLRELLPHENIRVSTANGRILLSGTLRDGKAVSKAMLIARQYAPDAVTNALSVRSSQQVLLEVRFIEASRSASRELGVGWRGRGSKINTNIGTQAGVTGAGVLENTALLSGAQPFGTLIARLLDNGSSADVIIKALEERGLARRLAEPNLIALSGDTASFLAGGEFPIPVSVEDGKVSVEFKQFGIALAFTPTVLDKGLINLKIIPEVSEIDPTTSVKVNGLEIPGLVVRRANTTVELRDGQSFAIAGLIQNNHTKSRAQLPWLGQVPVLGSLFRSARYSKNETDLVIIVTPRLVKPKGPGEKLATPLDTLVAGNDRDFFLNGRDEVKTTYNGYMGHIIQIGGKAKNVSYK